MRRALGVVALAAAALVAVGGAGTGGAAAGQRAAAPDPLVATWTAKETCRGGGCSPVTGVVRVSGTAAARGARQTIGLALPDTVKGAAQYCAWAEDAAGNASARVCAPLTIR